MGSYKEPLLIICQQNIKTFQVKAGIEADEIWIAAEYHRQGVHRFPSVAISPSPRRSARHLALNSEIAISFMTKLLDHSQ